MGVAQRLLPIALVLLAACQTVPKSAAGARASVEVAPPAKSDAWKEARDRRRPGAPVAGSTRAWQQALTEARQRQCAGDIRKEGVLLKPRAALAAPGADTGQL